MKWRAYPYGYPNSGLPAYRGPLYCCTNTSRTKTDYLMTSFWRHFALSIERFNTAIGTSLSWLILLMAAIVTLIVVMRSIFDLGWVALQESVTYMHASTFMLSLAYTAHQNGHVRVDIFYRKMSDEAKAWVDACGAVVFLLPFSVFLGLISWQFVVEAWAIHESSINPGGIPAVYALKTLMPITSALLVLRALGEIASQLVYLASLTQTAATTEATEQGD